MFHLITLLPVNPESRRVELRSAGILSNALHCVPALVLTLILAMAPSALAIPVTTQLQFEGLLDNGFDQGIIYEFFQPPDGELSPIYGVRCYFVPEDVEWRLPPDCRIQLQNGVIFVVRGWLNFGDVLVPNDRVSIEAVQGAGGNEHWGQIVIVGPDAGEPSQMVNCDVSGGGNSLAAPWNVGMISLTRNSPELTLTNCVFTNSAGHGILVHHDPAFSDLVNPNVPTPTLEVQNCIIGDEDDQITNTGILFSNISGLASIDINNNSELVFCGDAGFQFVNLIEQLAMTVTDSDIENNQWHGLAINCLPNNDLELGLTIERCNFVTNGEGIGRLEPGGFGVYVENADQPGGPDPAGTVTILQSTVTNNYSGGVALVDFGLRFRIDQCVIETNGHDIPQEEVIPPNPGAVDGRQGAGIYLVGMYGTNVIITDNSISDNGHEGLYWAQKHPDASLDSIRGNIFNENAFAIFDNPQNNWDLNPLLHGCNIILVGDVTNLDLSNNVLNQSKGGILLDGWLDDVDPEQQDRLPVGIRIVSNIQMDARIGLAVLDYDPAQGVSYCYNNNFSRNVLAGVYIADNDENHQFAGDQICSNIIYGNSGPDPVNDGYGIRNLEFGAQGANYVHNLFFGNDIDVEGNCGADEETTVFADPLFVNDLSEVAEGWQLMWNSPAINRGRNQYPNEEDARDAHYPDENDNPRDGSDNDIGAFGGPKSADYGFDPYCAILAGTELTNADLPDDAVGGRELLEWDYYVMFGNASVELDETFTIGPGVTINVVEGFGLTVNDGTIIAEGTDWVQGERILFQPFGELLPEEYLQEHPHTGIILDGGDGHRLAYLEIWGSSDYALHVGNQTVVDQFDSVRIHNNWNGLRVWGTVENIVNSEFHWNRYYGIFLATPEGPVTIDGCTVTHAQYGIRFYEYDSPTDGELFVLGSTITDCDWDCILISYPADNVTIAGCTLRNGDYGIYATSTAGAGFRRVTVDGCEIEDMVYYGIRTSYMINLRISEDPATTITRALGSGIYMSGNWTANIDNQSQILNAVISECCDPEDPNLAHGGIYTYNANPIIDGTFIHDNLKSGIYISAGADPQIVGSPNNANNIINNGVQGGQSTTLGAEIRIASSTAMGFFTRIWENNIYDVRQVGQNWVREGRIISKASSALNIDNSRNYYGNDREAGVADVAAGDFYRSGGGVFLAVLNEEFPDNPLGIYFDPRVEDRWGEVAGMDDEEEPANAFEAGIAAMHRQEWQTALDSFWVWIEREPNSHQAPIAARCIFYAERARDGDLNQLRETYLSLADNADERHQELWWSARKLAVQCLLHQDEYESAIFEYRRLQESAPNEVERLFVEMDILYAMETVELMHVDDTRDVMQLINETAGRIERLLAEDEEQSRLLLPSTVELVAVYPNPFNQSVLILYNLPDAAEVKLTVFDLAGRKVAGLSSGMRPAGTHQAIWNSNGTVSGGIYVIRLETDGVVCTRKLALVK